MQKKMKQSPNYPLTYSFTFPDLHLLREIIFCGQAFWHQNEAKNCLTSFHVPCCAQALESGAAGSRTLPSTLNLTTHQKSQRQKITGVSAVSKIDPLPTSSNVPLLFSLSPPLLFGISSVSEENVIFKCCVIISSL